MASCINSIASLYRNGSDSISVSVQGVIQSQHVALHWLDKTANKARIATYSLILLMVLTCQSLAWNALGHQLIAQIAYDHLTPHAKTLCDEMNQSFNSFSFSLNFVTAATWLDKIRGNDIHWFDKLHYVDLPFSNDRTMPSIPHGTNALWGIQQAVMVLSSNKSSVFDKGLSLRILIHVIGDIHQPLHTATKISNRFPKGDLGGNLFSLAPNPIGKNLHQYWDNGAGFLIETNRTYQKNRMIKSSYRKNKALTKQWESSVERNRTLNTSERIKNIAAQLENKWSCQSVLVDTNPTQWIQESYQLAIMQAYSLSPNTIPSQKYQLTAQNIIQKQLVFAGCRLAYVLNQLANPSAF